MNNSRAENKARPLSALECCVLACSGQGLFKTKKEGFKFFQNYTKNFSVYMGGRVCECVCEMFPHLAILWQSCTEF